MKKLVLLFLLVLAILPGIHAFAVPSPPEIAVNHETKECAEYLSGDECMSCVPPEGWEILGESFDVQCPADYTMVSITPVCEHFKNATCCTEGHSGASGDCEDLVVNDRIDQCAFVEDINACNLPRGWDARPVSVSIYEWGCPYEYRWEADLQCLDKPDSGLLPLQCGGFIFGGFLLATGLVIGVRQKQNRTRKTGKISS